MTPASGGRPGGKAEPGLRIVAVPADRLSELEPLWEVLYEHHRTLAPHLAEREVAFEHAWVARRVLEERWMRLEPRSFALLAYEQGHRAGYAFVRVRAHPGFAVAWEVSDPLAELVTLMVVPDARNRGIGSALLDAVDARLAELQIDDMVISVLTTNAEAMRLYERRGAVPFVTQMIHRVRAQRADM
jgi:ribosomal protein S18 acetylase RimI-like enzyme